MRLKKIMTDFTFYLKYTMVSRIMVTYNNMVCSYVSALLFLSKPFQFPFKFMQSICMSNLWECSSQFSHIWGSCSTANLYIHLKNRNVIIMPVSSQDCLSQHCRVELYGTYYYIYRIKKFKKHLQR